ncbi:MAG: hypothetical protein J6W84_00620 [Bacteroidales bacterium]|nr:hypothetical protein [Bacteroidales bacterium]MBQ7489999.1 hypothetical protein [Bacteroidales bacterium]
MSPNIQNKIDELFQEVSNIRDLNIKFDTLTYIEQQAAYQLWELEEDMRVDQNMKNI